MIIKKFRRNKILKNNLRNSILHNKNIVTNKFNINKYLTVKLENNKTNIYVEGVYFSQCKYLLFEVPTNEPNLAEEIDSIDDASEKLNNYLEKHDNRYLIPPEVEFWGHCSNLQAWVENEYDTRLLHRNIAFPLLKKLVDAGDPSARKVFKNEIIERYMSNYNPIKMYLIEEGYIAYLNPDEIKYILIDCKASLPTQYYFYVQQSVSLRWNHIACSYKFNGQPEKAFKIYNEILKLFPNDYEALVNLGSYLLEKKEYRKAFATYKKVLELKKGGIVCDEIAYLYFLNENYSKALEFCNLASKINPNLKFCLKRQRMYYHKKGILIRAIISYVNKFLKNPRIRIRAYFNFKILKLHIRGYLSNEL